MNTMEPNTAEKAVVMKAHCYLLSAGLSSDLMAGVLGFLDRESVINCVAVGEICHPFQLSDFYCPAHGNKLEHQTILRQELQDDEEDDAQGSTKTNAATLECEDCVMEEFGFERCPSCQKFHLMDDFSECFSCELVCCKRCAKKKGMRRCRGCSQWFCGGWVDDDDDETCQIQKCSCFRGRCSAYFCKTCSGTHNKCSICGNNCKKKAKYCFGLACKPDCFLARELVVG
ncbi:expressed unknown protein [Seminavis robusta]|uniref:Uncharacterized protein n=1 Tax=Seminavis robusta TaxID=568900 RepID=A0A9N8HU83_9STRA|nr:expressed unknown protein [Seminavis robusta]|eukprot:Sro1772_g296690.1 n/a (229) ;mRNA; f:10121-10807